MIDRCVMFNFEQKFFKRAYYTPQNVVKQQWNREYGIKES